MKARIITTTVGRNEPLIYWSAVYVAGSPSYPAPDYETGWHASKDIAQSEAAKWAEGMGYTVEAVS